MLAPAGPAAETVAELSWVLIVGALWIFMLVMAALAWSLRRPAPAAAAHRDGDSSGHDPATRRWILIGGLLLPVSVLVALLVYTSGITLRLAPPAGLQVPAISVVGRLWWWEVRYHDPASGVQFTVANEIHLPVGQPVTLGLASEDVIHSLWLPALAGKVDMVPGRVHQLRLQADRPGRFRGQCAEFCGEQHARMVLWVVARSPDDHQRWLAAQAAPARAPTDALALRGQQVFEQQRCFVCHAVRGLVPPDAGPAPGSAAATQSLQTGPDLTHLGSRGSVAAGSLPMSRESLAAWVADPQRHKPGARMPAYPQLDAASLQALAAFLVQLQ